MVSVTRPRPLAQQTCWPGLKSCNILCLFIRNFWIIDILKILGRFHPIFTVKYIVNPCLKRLIQSGCWKNSKGHDFVFMECLGICKSSRNLTCMRELAGSRSMKVTQKAQNDISYVYQTLEILLRKNWALFLFYLFLKKLNFVFSAECTIVMVRWDCLLTH